MDTLVLFSLSPNSWNSPTNNYSRVLPAQTTVYFICLKKTSLNFTCPFELEVLIYLDINTVLPGNPLSTETYTLISEWQSPIMAPPVMVDSQNGGPPEWWTPVMAGRYYS